MTTATTKTDHELARDMQKRWLDELKEAIANSALTQKPISHSDAAHLVSHVDALWAETSTTIGFEKRLGANRR